MAAVVELHGNFWADSRVAAAQRYHRSAPGLFVRGLDFLAGVSPDIEEPCIPAYMLALEEKQPRRIFNALVRNELWRPIDRRRRNLYAYFPLANGDLWRIVRGRETVPADVRAEVVARDGQICQLCQGAIYDGEVFHLDHILPWSQGGLSTVDNLQVTHAVCNLRKGARVPAGAA